MPILELLPQAPVLVKKKFEARRVATHTIDRESAHVLLPSEKKSRAKSGKLFTTALRADHQTIVVSSRHHRQQHSIECSSLPPLFHSYHYYLLGVTDYYLVGLH
jgi:hypothetical protein